MALRVDAKRTKIALHEMFDKWDIEQFSILRDREEYKSGFIKRGEGVTVNYLRKGIWQGAYCNLTVYDENLRRVFLFLDRIRIAEKQGIAYHSLSSTKDMVVKSAPSGPSEQEEDLEDAYDVLGVRPDDPVDLIKKVYQQKVQFYHPDKVGGDGEKFKRTQHAYEVIMKARQPAGVTQP